VGRPDGQRPGGGPGPGQRRPDDAGPSGTHAEDSRRHEPGGRDSHDPARNGHDPGGGRPDQDADGGAPHDHERPGPDGVNQRHAESTPAGTSYHRDDPDMGDLPQRVRPDPDGRYTVDVHVTPDGRARIGGHTYRPEEFADILRRNGDYDGRPIRLIGCDAGSNDFARRLSRELNTDVLAPTKPAWTDSHGRVFSSDYAIGPDGKARPEIPPNGEWQTHHPDGTTSHAGEDGFTPDTGDADKHDLDPTDAKDRGEGETDSSSRPADEPPTIDTKPDHIAGDLESWIYDGKRPGFTAETKYAVYCATPMNPNGSYVCSTSGVEIPVRCKPDGEPQFFEIRENNKAYRTDPPEWYTRWAEEGIPPTVDDLAPPHEKFTKPESNAAHMGHIDEAEYWRQQQFATYHEMTAEEFKQIYNNPDHYRLEAKAANESHQYESNAPGYGEYGDLRHETRPGTTDVKFPPIVGAPDDSDIYKGRPKPPRTDST